jgi:hypothetical protein
VRKVVRYRNILLIFTPDTVQSLAGKSPDDYVRSLVNNQVGAIWGNSVQVVENDVFFVSKQGIYAIRPNVYTQDNFNVAGLDVLIQDQFADEFIATDAVTSSGSASAQVQSTVFESQYIIYGLNGKIYRHYYDRRAWVTDTMSHLVSTNQVMRFSSPVIASFNGVQTLIEPMIKYNTSTSVVVSTDFTALDKSVYTDNGVAYTMKLRTKYFDLSQAFNFKKLRQLFIIARLQDDDVALSVTVQADSDVILTPDSGYISVDPLTGATTWVTTSTPNFNFYAGTILYTNFVTGLHPLGENTLAVLKTSIRAKCRRVRLEFKHTDGSECEIYGFGLEFRSKKP